MKAALSSVAQQLRRLADVSWLSPVIEPSDHEVNRHRTRCCILCVSVCLSVCLPTCLCVFRVQISPNGAGAQSFASSPSSKKTKTIRTRRHAQLCLCQVSSFYLFFCLHSCLSEPLPVSLDQYLWLCLIWWAASSVGPEVLVYVGRGLQQPHGLNQAVSERRPSVLWGTSSVNLSIQPIKTHLLTFMHRLFIIFLHIQATLVLRCR